MAIRVVVECLVAIYEEAIPEWPVCCELGALDIGVLLQEFVHEIFDGLHGRLTVRAKSRRADDVRQPTAHRQIHSAPRRWLQRGVRPHGLVSETHNQQSNFRYEPLPAEVRNESLIVDYEFH